MICNTIKVVTDIILRNVIYTFIPIGICCVCFANKLKTF